MTGRADPSRRTMHTQPAQTARYSGHSPQTCTRPSSTSCQRRPRSGGTQTRRSCRDACGCRSSCRCSSGPTVVAQDSTVPGVRTARTWALPRHSRVRWQALRPRLDRRTAVALRRTRSPSPARRRRLPRRELQHATCVLIAPAVRRPNRPASAAARHRHPMVQIPRLARHDWCTAVRAAHRQRCCPRCSHALPRASVALVGRDVTSSSRSLLSGSVCRVRYVTERSWSVSGRLGHHKRKSCDGCRGARGARKKTS